MNQENKLKLLFILNPNSGNSKTDWSAEITNYFASSNHTIELYDLPKNCNLQTLHDKIKLFAPQQVIAVGGDGTIRLVAECLLQKNIILGILPAGSANGLATDLGISNLPKEALDVLVNGQSKKIHLININGQLCIHLSDIGLNAYAMKKFKDQSVRGMWGYLVAALKVFWQNPMMEVQMKTAEEFIKIKAEMIVIANANKYGSNAVINPIGKLDDDLFEVIALKKISPWSILKVIFFHTEYDPEKTEIFQTHTLTIRSAYKVHFQVDGEYLGKVKEVKADLIQDALEIMVPAEQE